MDQSVDSFDWLIGQIMSVDSVPTSPIDNTIPTFSEDQLMQCSNPDIKVAVDVDKGEEVDKVEVELEGGMVRVEDDTGVYFRCPTIAKRGLETTPIILTVLKTEVKARFKIVRDFEGNECQGVKAEVVKLPFNQPLKQLSLASREQLKNDVFGYFSDVLQSVYIAAASLMRRQYLDENNPYSSFDAKTVILGVKQPEIIFTCLRASYQTPLLNLGDVVVSMLSHTGEVLKMDFLKTVTRKRRRSEAFV